MTRLRRSLWDNMKNKIIMLGLVMVIAFLLSLLPIYPLWVEGREFTQSGESLYHEWQFVSIRGYYDYAQYAQTAWLESTKVVYILLAITNPLVLVSVVGLAVRGVCKKFL